MLNYGHHPNTPLRMLVEARTRVPAAVGFVARIRAGVERARACLLKAQARQASYANRTRQDVQFAVGQLVMLHTKNVNMLGTKKLLPRWLGPFRIERVINPVAYRLTFPKSMGRIYPVFHVSLLKLYHADAARATFEPLVPTLSDEHGPVMEVERILDHRDVKEKHGGKGRTARTKVTREYLVKWHNYDDADATWEPESSLLAQAESMLAIYRKSVGKVLPGP